MVNIWSILDQYTGGRCPLCHQPGDGLCRACHADLPHNASCCHCCALPLPPDTPAGTLCAGCQCRAPAFDRVLAPLRYAPPVDDLISAFKYHGRLAHGRLLAEVLADTVRIAGGTLPTLLLPVPMHPSGLRERGFNQAAELARLVAADLGLAWTATQLRRLRRSQHQRGLNRADRQRNLRDAFAARGRLPRHLALIDDVVTTGATAHEVARTLRGSGVECVEVWAVARTPADRPSRPAGG